MGNHLALPFAIIFMDKLERSMLVSAEHQQSFYDRYVDDCLMTSVHGEIALVDFIGHCNSQHPNIRFTWEKASCGESVSYMDASIGIDREGQITYQLFQKPTDSGVILSYSSAIPMSLKMYVATQQFRRARALSSDGSHTEVSEKKITSLLQENGYPQHTIDNAKERAINPVNRKRRNHQWGAGTVFLKLPFQSDNLDRKIQGICRKSGLPVTIVYEQGNSLKKQLVRSAFRKPTCSVHDAFLEQERGKKKRGRPRNDCISCQAGLPEHKFNKQGVIYLLKCNICGEEYEGETRRTLRTRIGEHHQQARTINKDSPCG